MTVWIVKSQTAPGRTPWVPRVSINGVPEGASADQVLAALSMWGGWAALHARLPIGVAIKPVLERKGVAVDGCPLLEWEELAPKGRKVTVELDGLTYVAAQRAAVAAGMSLRAWTADAIAGAVS